MVVGPYLKTLLPLQAFSMKPPYPSTLISMKTKSLIHTLVYSHGYRLIRAFSKAKSTFIQICKQNKPIRYLISYTKTTKKNYKYKHKKMFFGSFRLHYNFGSSHVTPVPAPVLEGCTVISTTEKCDGDEDDTAESELSGYLQWLEEKKGNGGNFTGDQTDINEIDQLAEMFIANCHEKFMLEKQESYRRFQEMMARSM